MRGKVSSSSPETRRRPAREVIDAVLQNMRTNLEPLKYSTLAPSRYLIYLHPAEYARLEGILSILQEQTIRALSEVVWFAFYAPMAALVINLWWSPWWMETVQRWMGV